MATDFGTDGGDASGPRYSMVNDPAAWSNVDLGPLLTATSLFQNATFDGQYIYWGAIVKNEGGWDSALVRYDITRPFEDLSSWTTWIPSISGLEVTPLVFDGRYVYLGTSGGSTIAQEVRYDTHASFGSIGSLSFSKSLPDTLIGDGGAYTIGSRSATFDGRFVYFADLIHTKSGEITIRYDTGTNFLASKGWAASQPQPHGIAPATIGGRRLVFRPSTDSFAVDYNINGALEDNSSWTSFPIAALTGGETYAGTGTDGRYVYYVPTGGGPTKNGLVARHDGNLPLTDPGSWKTFQATLVSGVAKGFQHASWDGRYFYFMVGSEVTGLNGAILMRHDTLGDFESVTSWSAYDFTPMLPKTVTPPFWGGGVVFDGEYIYIAANNVPVVMRFLARNPRMLPDGFSGTFY